MSGFLYCAYNPCYGNIHKVGMTKQSTVNKRKPGFSTHCPGETVFLAQTRRIKNVSAAEKAVFEILKEYRLPKGEFFNCDLLTIKAAFNCIEELYEE